MARPSRGGCLWNRQLGYGEYFDRIHLTLHADKGLEAADSPYLLFKDQPVPFPAGMRHWFVPPWSARRRGCLGTG